MKTELELNEKILAVTNRIREKHPELLEYLNEMPITIPYEENPTINVKALSSYYDSLVALVEDYEYEENTIINGQPENTLHLPIKDIVKMEQDNSYEDLLTEVNDITISYNDVGEGIVPVIFVHGFPFSKSMWKGQLDSLKSSNRVIVFDIRGFGQSTNNKANVSMDFFADDLVAFMDKLNIDKAVICGLSMGGYIALNAISRFPERFAALVLCDTQCIADTTEKKEGRYKTIEQINNDVKDVFYDKFIKTVFHADSLTNNMEVVENLQNIVFANSKKIITAGLAAMAERSETCSTLAAIKIPTLIICGREDELTPLAKSEFMQERIKGSVLKIIDDAAHVSNLEQPEAFNKYLQDFLNTLNAAKGFKPKAERTSMK
ncbi:MAG: alpha/beta hydrolase [Bacteroidia bacterium]